jgi:multisubunit Na+/H+ antiporter MnhB subunit
MFNFFYNIKMAPKTSPRRQRSIEKLAEAGMTSSYYFALLAAGAAVVLFIVFSSITAADYENIASGTAGFEKKAQNALFAYQGAVLAILTVIMFLVAYIVYLLKNK